MPQKPRFTFSEKIKDQKANIETSNYIFPNLKMLVSDEDRELHNRTEQKKLNRLKERIMMKVTTDLMKQTQ